MRKTSYAAAQSATISKTFIVMAQTLMDIKYLCRDCTRRFAPKLPRAQIQLQSFKDDISNNLFECFNKQCKAWYKTKEGFSSFEAADHLIISNSY